MAVSARKRKRVPTQDPPRDALFRLGMAIRREGNVPPRPSNPDPITGRYDPLGFYTVNHYTGKPILGKYRGYPPPASAKSSSLFRRVMKYLASLASRHIRSN
jgi:hypothetical protein